MRKTSNNKYGYGIEAFIENKIMLFHTPQNSIFSQKWILKSFYCQKMIILKQFLATPIWGKCEDETCTPKSGNLESSGSPETSELDCKGQNTLPWGILYTIGKLLKCRRRKWPRMSHSDICNTSYGRKKGRESNW